MMLTKDTSDTTLRHLCVIKCNYMSEANKADSYVLRFNDHLAFENTGDRVSLDELVEEDDYIQEARQMKKDGKSFREIEKELNSKGYEVSKSSIQRRLD